VAEFFTFWGEVGGGGGGGGEGGGWCVFLFSVYSSAFLLVLSLLSLGAVLYCFLWISRGCGRVPRSSGGSGWAPVPSVVYTPSCRGGWFHKTD